MFSNPTVRWSILIIVIFAIILIPFMLFGEQIEAWTDIFIATMAERKAIVALVLGGLLASDIFVPVPSSLVSTAAGALLGLIPGMLASWAGMTISCVIGFWVGDKFGRPAAERFVGADELDRLERLSQRYGYWAILVSRPVPMLAEASVLFAGISHMPWWRFMLLSALSNLGVSAVYAVVGALSANVNSFLLAFFGAILIPALAMWLMNRQTPKRAKS
ncbi:MAG: VTT domain-containing protein [Anaerolineae bacterium]|nr:VTT domain-containing protein [Anaerolineae bacterium]